MKQKQYFKTKIFSSLILFFLITVEAYGVLLYPSLNACINTKCRCNYHRIPNDQIDPNEGMCAGTIRTAAEVTVVYNELYQNIRRVLAAPILEALCQSPLELPDPTPFLSKCIEHNPELYNGLQNIVQDPTNSCLTKRLDKVGMREEFTSLVSILSTLKNEPTARSRRATLNRLVDLALNHENAFKMISLITDTRPGDREQLMCNAQSDLQTLKSALDQNLPINDQVVERIINTLNVRKFEADPSVAYRFINHICSEEDGGIEMDSLVYNPNILALTFSSPMYSESCRQQARCLSNCIPTVANIAQSGGRAGSGVGLTALGFGYAFAGYISMGVTAASLIYDIDDRMDQNHNAYLAQGTPFEHLITEVDTFQSKDLYSVASLALGSIKILSGASIFKDTAIQSDQFAISLKTISTSYSVGKNSYTMAQMFNPAGSSYPNEKQLAASAWNRKYSQCWDQQFRTSAERIFPQNDFNQAMSILEQYTFESDVPVALDPQANLTEFTSKINKIDYALMCLQSPTCDLDQAERAHLETIIQEIQTLSRDSVATRARLLTLLNEARRFGQEAQIEYAQRMVARYENTLSILNGNGAALLNALGRKSEANTLISITRAQGDAVRREITEEVIQSGQVRSSTRRTVQESIINILPATARSNNFTSAGQFELLSSEKQAALSSEIERLQLIDRSNICQVANCQNWSAVITSLTRTQQELNSQETEIDTRIKQAMAIGDSSLANSLLSEKNNLSQMSVRNLMLLNELEPVAAKIRLHEVSGEDILIY